MKEIKSNLWLSKKGVNFVLAPKRGMCTSINGDIAQPLTAKGQNNWTGTFISPDIDHIVRSTEIGGSAPTVIYMIDGSVLTYDGTEYKNA